LLYSAGPFHDRLQVLIYLQNGLYTVALAYLRVQDIIESNGLHEVAILGMYFNYIFTCKDNGVARVQVRGSSYLIIWCGQH
jgi:hypothetical protein